MQRSGCFYDLRHVVYVAVHALGDGACVVSVERDAEVFMELSQQSVFGLACELCFVFGKLRKDFLCGDTPRSTVRLLYGRGEADVGFGAEALCVEVVAFVVFICSEGGCWVLERRAHHFRTET